LKGVILMSWLNFRRQFAASATQALISSLVLLLSGWATTAHATTIDDYRFEGTYGTGKNHAALVVDFSPKNGDADSFAFDVRFDTDTISGLALMNAVAAGTSAAKKYNYTKDPDYTTTTFVVGMSYNGYSMVSNGDTGDSLMYWTSNNAGGIWNLAWNPIDSLALDNNDTLGWLTQVITWKQVGQDWVSDPPMNEWSVPVAPMQTPEPSTLALLAIGTSAALAWRSRWRKQ